MVTSSSVLSCSMFTDRTDGPVDGNSGTPSGFGERLQPLLFNECDLKSGSHGVDTAPNIKEDSTIKLHKGDPYDI